MKSIHIFIHKRVDNNGNNKERKNEQQQKCNLGNLNALENDTNSVPAYKILYNIYVHIWLKCAYIFAFSNIKIGKAKRQFKHDFVQLFFVILFFNI